jgi:hypothetical protein
MQNISSAPPPFYLIHTIQKEKKRGFLSLKRSSNSKKLIPEFFTKPVGLSGATSLYVILKNNPTKFKII